MTAIASQALSSAQKAAQPTLAARNRVSSSTKNGELPDGREIYIRKPRMKRQWEPVKNHTCSSCGMLYPRAPFDWEELGNTEDGKVICALRKVSLYQNLVAMIYLTSRGFLLPSSSSFKNGTTL
jgi:hypothetical protein